MNIIILSKKVKTYFNDRFTGICQEMLNSDIKISILDPSHCQLYLDSNDYQLFHKGESIKNVDYVITRTDLSAFDYNIGIIKFFEDTGVKVLNGSEALLKCKNKFAALNNLKSLQGVKIPKSVLIKSPKDVELGVKLAGGLPVVLKMTSSDNNGLGSILVNNLTLAESFLDINFLFDNFMQVGQNIIIQEFINDSSGKAINHLILGDNVISSNVSTRTVVNNIVFNKVEKTENNETKFSNTSIDIALNIAKAFKLDFCTISMLESTDGIYVFKINPIPDIEELEKVYKIDVIPKLISYIAQIAKSSKTLTNSY